MPLIVVCSAGFPLTLSLIVPLRERPCVPSSLYSPVSETASSPVLCCRRLAGGGPSWVERARTGSSPCRQSTPIEGSEPGSGSVAVGASSTCSSTREPGITAKRRSCARYISGGSTVAMQRVRRVFPRSRLVSEST